MSMRHPDLDYMFETQRRHEMVEAARYRLVKEAEMAAGMTTEVAAEKRTSPCAYGEVGHAPRRPLL